MPLSGLDQARGINRLNRVFDAIIRITDNNTVNALRDFLVNNEDYLVNLLRNFPQHVILLDQNPELVRCLWRKHLFSRYHHNDLKVFAALLRANMIPQEEVAEANDKTVTKIKGNIPSPADKQTLDQYGFFAMFSKIAFTDGLLNSFILANRNDKLICWYLESYPIPIEAVRSICSIFTKSTYYPFEACDELKKLFKENPTKRQEFEKIAQQEQLTLSEEIFGE
uniref:hypothetical protein n=1 Tax=Candidatus Electronema sp. TaxID=2698783 RepID=UPI004055D0D1